MAGCILENKLKIKKQNYLNSSEFEETKRVGGLVIDQTHKLWYVEPPLSRNPYFHSFSDLVDFKLVEDGMEYKSHHGVTRAVMGGAMFGIAGAAVGAATAKKKATVNSMYILATTKDFDRAAERIYICTSKVSTDSATYSGYVQNANEILGLLTAIQANA